MKSQNTNTREGPTLHPSVVGVEAIEEADEDGNHGLDHPREMPFTFLTKSFSIPILVPDVTFHRHIHAFAIHNFIQSLPWKGIQLGVSILLTSEVQKLLHEWPSMAATD
ncbi:unnamed protein product [Sphenostylis stenocarpa]|uniref:Uncharacterized protein n=1 Tax=Sphenostylis stenocarpa TaxID=92480 RepID=A0AA86S830_9FABA|nr:unnamed protein product [Sphenostylis stenocarpa]